MLKKKINIITINQLLNVHSHVGNKQAKWNPLIKNFLFGSRHGVHFFNLKKILPYLKRLIYFLSKSIANHKIILFVGTHNLVTVLIKFLSKNTFQFSITQKWVSGTLTNWLRIKPYIKFLYKTNIKKIRKKFILRTEKKIQQKIVQYLKMKHLFFGIEKMSVLPNFIIILEKDSNSYTFLEAYKLMIPIISIINSDQSGFGVSYPIFGNDNLFDSLFYYSNIIYEAIKTGIQNKRLFFLNLGLSFFLLVQHKINNKKNYLNYKSNFNKYFLNKHFFFLRNYRNYKFISIKRLIRKYCFTFKRFKIKTK
jgi:small subunit ribosomal protein S2